MRRDAAGSSDAGVKPRGLVSTVLITAILGTTAGLLWIGRGRLAVGFVGASLALLSLLLWRLYEGDVWVGWFAPLAANGLLQWIVAGGVALALVLPFRRSSLPNKRYARGRGVVMALLGATALALLFAVGVRSFLVQPFSIPATSMQPALLVGDHIFVSKRAYGYGPYSPPFGPWSFFDRERVAPARGDIAVFRYPPDPSVDYVKRVIGLPGDTVQLVGGVVQINGIPVKMEAVEPPPHMLNLTEPGAVFYRETLPEGRSYLIQSLVDGGIGDDTSAFVVPAGHYFVMGDNRDNSNDSRFHTGYVPEQNLVGRADVIYWNGEGASFQSRRDLSK